MDDGKISLLVEFRGNNQNIKNPKVMVAMTLLNHTEENLHNLRVSFPGSMSASVDGEVTTPSEVGPKTTTPFNVVFRVVNFIPPPRVHGSVSYEAGEAGPVNKSFEVLIPSSVFMVGARLASDQLMKILAESASTLSTISADLRVPGTDLKPLLAVVPQLLHLEAVPVQPGSAFYGRSIAGHHVALRIKAGSASPTMIIAHVDIRCSDATLGSALLTELASVFPRQI